MLNFAKFCETKGDFHNIYGLSLEGVDPAVLSDKLISDVDWMMETLAFCKTDLEKATMADAMESKVTVAVTTIRNKIQVTIVLLVCDCVINNFCG